MVVAGDGTIVCANDAAQELFGTSTCSTGTRIHELATDEAATDAALALFSNTRSAVPAVLNFRMMGQSQPVHCEGAAVVSGASAAETYLFIKFRLQEPASRSFIDLNQKLEELNREVSARRRTEALLAGQQEVLQLMLRDAPLVEVLHRLCVAVEQQSDSGALASILLLEGDHLRHGAAPSLPTEYCRAIDGVRIGPAAGSCGTAAFQAKAVVVEDIQSSALWVGFQPTAERAGLRACWSTPVLASDGRVLGTFAMYYRRPQKPTAADWKVIDLTTRAAAIAIERSRVEAERRSREDALRRKDEQLSAALTASDTGTYRWNPWTNEYLYFDANLARLFGFSPDEHIVPPADFLHRVHEEDKSEVIRRLLRAREGAGIEMEYRVVLPDGSTRWLYDRGKFLESEGCVVGACTDITARKDAEEALRESERQFRMMADAIPQLAWMTDQDGYVYWYNRRWYDYTGATAQEMAGWGWQKVHDPNELPRVIAKWTAAVREGVPWEDSFPLRGNDGEYRMFLSRATPIRDNHGNVVRWFGTNTDISEHLKAQEALRRSEKLAAAGRLAASIAHEINNPLEAVTNLLYLVQHDPETPERSRQYLKLADEELQRVAHIARQTLGFYKETTHPVKFSVSATLDEVVRLHGRKLAAKQISVQRAYRDAGDITGSRGELQQVLANLVSNAIDATEAHGRPLRLHISRTTSGSGQPMLRVSVGDSGIGIAPEHLTRIFEPFFTTKKDIGTGLGLWVTREIVEKLGGKLYVKSRLGKGTVFSVTVPAVAAAKAATRRQSNVA